ncbi:MAG: hypothetical protein LBM98_11070 [Oscillospiraceae bacterium]|nr:hypothetical protein [Oscillospiraceae bacterium]
MRSNPVPGGKHTSYVSQDYYVNPGLLRRISLVRIASAVAASQRRAGRSPALSRRIAPGRWTRLRPRTARGHHPGATRCVPSQEGKLRRRLSQPRDPRPNPFPSWEGCRPQAAGWSPRAVRGRNPVLPSKAPLFRGGCRRSGGGCPAPCASSNI